MADIVNTPRGPKLLPTGSIRAMVYVIPVMPELTATLFGKALQGRDTHEREYYKLGLDDEWHWSHTEKSTFQKYPCYQEPEHWTGRKPIIPKSIRNIPTSPLTTGGR